VAIEQDSVVPSSFYSFGHPGSAGKQLTNDAQDKKTNEEIKY
jgi:hypothetical protein